MQTLKKSSSTRRQFMQTMAAGALGASSVMAIGGCMDSAGAQENVRHLYVGTYTDGKSKGIYKYLFNLDSGEIGGEMLVAKAENPSFLAIHPSGNWLYAVIEIGEVDGEATGLVQAFSIAPDTGELLLLNEQKTRGGVPCHVSIDATGKWLFVANYTGGSIASFPIEEGGVLGEAVSVMQHAGSSVNESRQQGPHAHSVTLDPQNKRVIAADLGIDQLLSYDINPETGALTPADSPSVTLTPGAGPRHFVFHPNGKHAFVINELDSTLNTLRYNEADGGFEILNTVSTVPADFEGTSYCADVHVSPDGKFVYGSNRGHNSIFIASFDETTGALEAVGNESTGGKWPRNFMISPDGRFLLAANQHTDSIIVFRVDKEMGALTRTTQHVKLPAPACLVLA